MFSGKKVWMVFNATHDSLLGKTNLAYFTYMCLLSVETFPFLVVVILLGKYKDCAIGFP